MRCGATIFDADGLTLGADEKRFFREADPFGFILFARNIETPDQVYGLCCEMRDAVGRDALITIDQEGGRVQRLRAPHWRDWPAARATVDAAGSGAAQAMYLRYRLIAAELRALTIDSNCAPLADIAGPWTHPFLQDRCYGQEPSLVAVIARSVADGLLAGGVLPVLKHVPGHGRARADSHAELPVVTEERETLTTTDFAPFQALNDLPMAMTAHIRYGALDDAPATVSATMVQAIRGEIGFQGLLMTDDLSMKALDAPVAQSARAAREAGCDVVLLCNQPLAVRAACAEAAGQLDDAGSARAEAALAARQAPDGADISALDRELEAILQAGGCHG